MFGIVLAAHGEVAPALLAAAEGIVGGLDGVRAVSLQAGGDPDQMRDELLDAIRAVDAGDGVLMLVDMFGGTPSNVCLTCGAPSRLEVVTGVNLPMVVKATTVRDSSLADAAQLITAYGQRHVAHATEILRERRRRAGADPEGASASR